MVEMNEEEAADPHTATPSGLQAAEVGGWCRGLRSETIPEPQQQQSPLSDGQLHELARLSKQVERAFGHPIDLEWVWDTERVWVVQARPITGVQPPRL